MSTYGFLSYKKHKVKQASPFVVVTLVVIFRWIDALSTVPRCTQCGSRNHKPRHHGYLPSGKVIEKSPVDNKCLPVEGQTFPEGYLSMLNASFAPNVRRAQRCRRPKAFAHRFARTDHEHDDGEGIGDHLEEKAPIRIVVERVVPEQEHRGGLEIEDQATQRAEGVSAGSCPERVPLGEDGQADGDPALTGGGHMAEPAGRDREADRRAAQAGQHAADEGVQIAHAIDVDAHCVRRRRVLAHGPQVQARSGVVDVVPGCRGQQIAHVDHNVLVGEQNVAQEGNCGQDGDGERSAGTRLHPLCSNPRQRRG